MGRSANAGRQVALRLVLGAVLTLVLPALASSDTTTPAVASVIVALAALAALAPRSLSRAACTNLTTSPVADTQPLVLPDRVTDRVHHPLRPRAPGQV